MKQVIYDFGTTYQLSYEEMKTHCKFGQEDLACCFLASGPDGWECVKDSLIGTELKKRFDSGTTKSKGCGDWEECLIND